MVWRSKVKIIIPPKKEEKEVNKEEIHFKEEDMELTKELTKDKKKTKKVK